MKKGCSLFPVEAFRPFETVPRRAIKLFNRCTRGGFRTETTLVKETPVENGTVYAQRDVSLLLARIRLAKNSIIEKRRFEFGPVSSLSKHPVLERLFTELKGGQGFETIPVVFQQTRLDAGKLLQPASYLLHKSKLNNRRLLQTRKTRVFPRTDSRKQRSANIRVAF